MVSSEGRGLVSVEERRDRKVTNSIINEAEFENAIRTMSDRQLTEFTARQIFDVCKNCAVQSARLDVLEGRDKKFVGVVGGVGGVLGGAIIAVLNWLSSRA